MKKVHNLSGLVELVGKGTVDKCFTKYMMLMVAKTSKTDKFEELLNKVNEEYDKISSNSSESKLKNFCHKITTILCDYKDFK